ncbi:hypothetical protein LguiB_010401 [Lonicera macranthoides]
MFSLQIHTVDTPKPFYATTSTTNGLNPTFNTVELKCIVHLFRNLPSSSSSSSSTTITNATSLSNPSARTTLLFIVAVPNYLSPDEFLLFCGSHLDHFSELLFLRNDGMEDRYSVLIRLVNQLTADGFYCNFNGKRFKPSEAEVCHMYFTQSVEYADLAEIACAPPPGFIELPTCPVCLERLDQDTSSIQSTLCDHSFHCSCVSKWTYLSCQVCRLCQEQDDKPTCAVCGTLKNPWVCLICGFVGCGRYEEGHAIRHWNDSQHCYSLELETQQIWDYVGDKYVHRLNQSKIDAKSVSTNFRCSTCGYNEDSGISSALVSSKGEAIEEEYNHLLASQMKIQRQNYEALLAEARSKKDSLISKAVEMAEVSRMRDIQYKLDEFAKEKKAVTDTNQNLMKKQEVVRKVVKEIEEREILSLKSRDEKIRDLEEQIRDLKVYIEAQRTVAKMTDSEGIKGGTLLPVQSNQSSTGGNSKRRTKTGRRRN